ncbi:MAG: hypothetical protein C4294_09700, partial [Nitrospiraceae bacterium]
GGSALRKLEIKLPRSNGLAIRREEPDVYLHGVALFCTDTQGDYTIDARVLSRPACQAVTSA